MLAAPRAQQPPAGHPVGSPNLALRALSSPHPNNNHNSSTGVAPHGSNHAEAATHGHNHGADNHGKNSSVSALPASHPNAKLARAATPQPHHAPSQPASTSSSAVVAVPTKPAAGKAPGAKGKSKQARNDVLVIARGLDGVQLSGATSAQKNAALAAKWRTVIEDLPPELLLEILSHLSAKDLSKLSMVSRLFRELAGDSILWKGLCKVHPGRHSANKPTEPGACALRGMPDSLGAYAHWRDLFHAQRLPVWPEHTRRWREARELAQAAESQGGFFSNMARVFKKRPRIVRVVVVGLTGSGKSTVLNRMPWEAYLAEREEQVAANPPPPTGVVSAPAPPSKPVKPLQSDLGRNQVVFECKAHQGKLTEFHVLEAHTMCPSDPDLRERLAQADAMVVVHDSTRKDIIDSKGAYVNAVHELIRLMPQGASVLVMANKRDLPNVSTTVELMRGFALNTLVNRRWRIHTTIARVPFLAYVQGSGVIEALSWLSGNDGM